MDHGIYFNMFLAGMHRHWGYDVYGCLQPYPRLHVWDYVSQQLTLADHEWQRDLGVRVGWWTPKSNEKKHVSKSLRGDPNTSWGLVFGVLSPATSNSTCQILFAYLITTAYFLGFRNCFPSTFFSTGDL